MAGAPVYYQPASSHELEPLSSRMVGHQTHKTMAVVDEYGKTESRPKHFSKFGVFYALTITTIIACLLVAANESKWSQGGRIHQIITSNRASVQIAVQVLANLLGLIHVTAICRLINYATRIRLRKAATSLDTLRAWVALSTPRTDWDLPVAWLLPLIAFVTFSLVPAALWAGAITPVSTTAVSHQSLLLPSYEDISMIKGYPGETESSQASPLVRNTKGLFTYNIGTRLSGKLLSDAASATTTDSNQRQHAKLDDTGYSYFGRSYGVGATTGLLDTDITSYALATRYRYQEAGYLANVTCIYNKSAALSMEPESTYMYSVIGSLPDSTPGKEEYVNYAGVGDTAIVALVVAGLGDTLSRYLGIIAGSSYKYLNGTQCLFDFTPTLFNVSVGIIGRNISVVPAKAIPDFNPERNLTRTVTQQFGQISAIETNLYTSVVGNALNSSIAGWVISHPNSTSDTATLAGLEQAFLVIADDLLVAFGSAQLMVGNFSENTTAQVLVNVSRFGSSFYIYAIFAINFIIVFAFVIEAYRSRFWRKLIQFDYLDARTLIVSSAIDGHTFVDAVLQAKQSASGDIGRMLVRLRNWNGMAIIQYAGMANNRQKSEGERVDVAC